MGEDIIATVDSTAEHGCRFRSAKLPGIVGEGRERKQSEKPKREQEKG
jgi:hypothetical protein